MMYIGDNWIGFSLVDEDNGDDDNANDGGDASVCITDHWIMGSNSIQASDI